MVCQLYEFAEVSHSAGQFYVLAKRLRHSLPKHVAKVRLVRVLNVAPHVSPTVSVEAIKALECFLDEEYMPTSRLESVAQNFLPELEAIRSVEHREHCSSTLAK